MAVKKTRGGFTIIEATLFLAISGLLIVALLVGTSNSVARHRYNDSVNSFADFLRSQIADVQNYKSPGGTSNVICYISGDYVITAEDGSDTWGKSPCFAYGISLMVNELPNTNNVIDSWAIVGSDFDPAKSAPSGCGVNSLSPWCQLRLTRVRKLSSYSPEWGARLQNSDGSTTRGVAMIMRNPKTGSIQIFLWSGDVFPGSLGFFYFGLIGYFKNNLPSRVQSLNFCIASDDLSSSSQMRMVRLREGPVSPSSVEIMPLDTTTPEDRCS